jgi:DNA mismatch endonuclease (patch repair protein)
MSILPIRVSGSSRSRTVAEVSDVMSRVRSSATEPEILLRQALRRAGIRSFRAWDASLPGKPDIVIPGKGLAIFVDGDYWHGNQYRLRGFDSLQNQLAGINNADYWSRKIRANVDRDFRNTAALLSLGRVVRLLGKQH